ncbi:Anaphase-promoting complex subunit 11 [Linum perenne]
MKVVVEILTGNFFYVHVREDGTVGDLRRAISEQQKLPIDRLMLVLMLIEDDVIWLVMNEDEGEKSNLSLTKCGVHDGSHMWHAVASWTWDAKDETCGICRMAFDGCCPDCKLPGDDCPLIWGKCNHAFHLHCILKWVNSQTSQAHCPMCRGEWQFKDS